MMKSQITLGVTPTFAAMVFILTVRASAAELRFRHHDLNPESTYSGCAAIDVNHDGRLDVVCGGWWYEAPTWKRHFLREVEMIRGRYDDYSNLPLDVNGDGWTDIINANYRSSKIYWTEHPGESLGPWTVHLVAHPGHMETGRLVDVDGDGVIDLLPNGTEFAAWWEIKRQGTAGGKTQPVWIRHDLPDELMGHGVGFGDINGDGRGDLVGPKGWLEAPADRRTGEWIWHPELHLSRPSIPILIYDVDGDGDNDLLWARGHEFGLYWLEQQSDPKDTEATRRWTRHAIDTSFSQFHALLRADIDGDGQKELIAGKRYKAHEGLDPGAYDPLVICSYKYQPATSTFSRQILSWGLRAGFGVDPKVVDLDGDGDLDLLCPGRSGLVWLENLIVDSQKHPDAPYATSGVVPAVPHYASRSNLLLYQDATGHERAVETPDQWGIRRTHILKALEEVIGRLPDPTRRLSLEVKIIEEVDTPHYVRKKLTYRADLREPGDRVPAYLLIPKELQGKAPAVLCLHRATESAKSESAGLAGDASLHTADKLAKRGYVCIVPDYPSFGEYRYDFKQLDGKHAGGTMKAIWNNIRAIDLLETLSEVDIPRIGCIGHSFGGLNALLTAVFDQRIRAVVASCGFAPFDDTSAEKRTQLSAPHSMPRIGDLYKNDPTRLPFDFYEVIAALSPRAAFINAPREDPHCKVSGVKRVTTAAREIYKLQRGEARLRVVHPECGHEFPNTVQEEAFGWLDRYLKGRPRRRG